MGAQGMSSSDDIISHTVREGGCMSEISVSLRLVGDLPPSEELTRLLGTQPTTDRRRGQLIHPRTRRIQPIDVWSLDLTGWQRGHLYTAVLPQAATTLQQMAPALAALDRTGSRAQLYISAIRDEESGGFDLPAELIAAAGAAGLEMAVSILCDVEDDDEDDSPEREGEPTGTPGGQVALT
jgi:hypothetical protein